EPAAVIADAGLIGLLETVAPRLTSAPAFLHATAANGAHLVRLGSRGAPPIHSADSPPLLQLYTSGSVGTPKRVVRTHASLLAEVKALERVFAIDERDRFLGVTSFSHVNGLVRTMLSSMFVGATLYPEVEFRRRQILDTMTRERITF